MSARIATPPREQPVEDEIRNQAYLLWEAAGCPPGDGVNFWCEAERQLTLAQRLEACTLELRGCEAARGSCEAARDRVDEI